MENKKHSNNYMTIVLFVFLIMPFLSIYGIRNMLSTTAYQVWQMLSILIFFLLFLIKRAQIKLSWAIFLFCAYQLIILFSSSINNVITPGIAAVTIAAMLLFILFQTDLYHEMLISLCIIIIVSLLVNFPLMLIQSEDVNAEFFIGGKNALGIFLIPGLFLLIINSFEKHKKITMFTIAAVFLCLLTVFIGGSATGVVVAFVTLMLMLISIRFKPNKVFYIGVIFVIYLLFIFLSDVFFKTEAWMNFTEFLGKDNTLTSRTTIWELARDLIKENWLLGAGRGAELSYVNSWGEEQTIYEAHNFVLQIMMQGGIFALLIFGSLLFKTVALLDFNNVKHKIVFIALCILLINGLTESTVNGFLVAIILSIACRYANEKKKIKVNNE